MITSVTMIRKMGQYNVLQRTKDGYFDANVLLKQWNSERVNPQRKMILFLESPKTIEFIEQLKLESHGAKMEYGNIEPVIKKKGRNTKNGKTQDEVWMHPYLFIDFAMWINPVFKLSVIKFVYDELISQRTLAGDNYKNLSSALVKLNGYSFQEVAKAIQWIVFNKTGKELRQKATKEQLKEINDIQMKLAFAIDMGYIQNYQSFMQELRRIYNKKYIKF